MSAPNGINLIFGAGGYGTYLNNLLGVDSARALIRDQLEVLSAEGVRSIDTSELYEGSEEELAHHDAAKKFIIHTKVKGGFAAGRTTDEIVEVGKERLRLLKTTQVEVLYLHAPDSKTPLDQQVKGYNELYKQGAFKQLGLSNFSPEEVQKFYDAAVANDCVVPTVYEGAYNAVGRLPELELFPLLRKLGIAYNAYSPIAGGLLAKPKEDFLAGVSRFDTDTFLGKLYSAIYNKPSFLEALDSWGRIAEEAGISRAELAFRWVVYHSALKGEHGDGIIFGARDATQEKETLKFINAGPLPENVAKKASDVWGIVQADATFDNWSGYLKGLFQG
ncbi:unnamed protein product [Clonostachys solani]|uniref:NADP-dependent oxidoreductase domain-containing protein n=1 Tax=Clonostachys solani TaxID=160281 RepID=A0A9N9VYK7_9HYPO|nr:unnamed protein product [Clonostachys solani]